MMTHILVPELVDEIFEFLDARDIHTCLFVSRQFNAHALQFIYHTISLKGGSNPLNSPSEKSKVPITLYFIADYRSSLKHKRTFGKLFAIALRSLST